MRASAAMALCLLCALVACAAPKPVVPPSALNRLQSLRDPDFNGGLNAQEMALADSLAKETTATIPGDFGVCVKRPWDAPGPDYSGLKDADPEALAKQVPPPLAPFAQLLLHGSPEQQAVVAHSIKLMGKRAGGLESLLYVDYMRGLNPWKEEALHALNCSDPWMRVGIEAMAPEAKRPAKGKQESCDAIGAAWVLDRVMDSTRTWPDDYFKAAWTHETEDCRYTGIGRDLDLSQEEVLGLKSFLDDPASDPQRVVLVIELVSDLGVQANPLAPEALRFVDSSDRDLAYAARSIVLTSAIPEAVDIFRHSALEHDDSDPWWQEYVPGLGRYADQLIPILTTLLKRVEFGNKAEVAIALGQLHSPKIIQPLLGVFSNNDWVSTQAAVAALAQFTPDHPEVRRALEEVAKTYWSGRVREAARIALKTGKGFTGDPFGRCDNATVIGASEPPDDGKKGLTCLWINYGGSIDHHQKTCRDGTFHSGMYLTADRRRIRIQWRSPVRQELPRGKIDDLSTWCRSVGDVEILKTKGGALVGCSGLESSGGLGFLPDDSSLPLQRIGYIDTRTLSEIDGHIYATASDPFWFEDAGAMLELTQQPDGKWHVEPLAALPSPPTAVAKVGKALALSDQENAILYDPEKGISLLTCED
jgi:hypothetical protein